MKIMIVGRKAWTALIGITIIPAVLFSFQNQPLYHKLPDKGKVGEDLELSVMMFDDVNVLDAKIYFREVDAISFSEIEMHPRNLYWVGTIPGRRLSERGLEYCIVLHLSDGSALGSPFVTPFENPHRIQIEPGDPVPSAFSARQDSKPESLLRPDILILSPEPAELVRPDNVVIAVSLFNAPQVDTNLIRLELDGTDFTSAAEIESGIVTLTPPPLSDGLHTVVLNMTTVHGLKSEPLTWSFTVARGVEVIAQELEYGGNLGSRVSMEEISGQNYDVNEITGEGFVKIPFLSLKGSLRLTSRESSFNQPQNRLQIFADVNKYLQVYYGDFNPRMSSFMIDGKRVRGTGIFVDIPWVRFQYVNGELNRNIQHQNEMDKGYYFLSSETTTDSLGVTTYVLDRKGYTFTRDLTAVRLSVGPKYGWHVGLHALQARDDLKSVDNFVGNQNFSVDSTATLIPEGTYTYSSFVSAVESAGGKVDFPSSGWTGEAPADNVVFGFDIGSAFDDRKLTLDFSWNMSLYNRDIWEGAMTRTQMDTALDDTLDGLIGVTYDENGLANVGTVAIDTAEVLDPIFWKSFFTINANMTPLVPFDVTTKDSNPIATFINMPSSAFNLRLKGHYSRNNFIIEYRQVGPEYVSLGNPYLTSNVREFILSNRLALMEYKLFLTGTYKYRDNEILRSTLDPLNTTTLSLSVTLNPGADAPSYVFNLQTIGKYNEKTEMDTVGGERVDLREDSRALNSLASVTLPFLWGANRHHAVINYNTIKNTDKLDGKRAKDYLFPKTDTETISINLASRFDSPLRTNLSFSNTELLLPQTEGDSIVKVPYTWTSISMNGQYAFPQQKIRLTGGFSYLSSKGSTDTAIYGLKTGAEWDVMTGFLVTLSGVMQVTQTDEDTEINTTGIILKLKYNF